MAAEYTLSQNEVNDLLRKNSKEPYKMQGHSWQPMSHIGKQVCKNCGLVMLRNQATAWCVDKGCNHSDHPQYESAMKRLTKRQW